MSEANNPAGLTEQGQRVTEHWSNLAVTYEGAIEALRRSGVDPEAAKAEDLHGLDMIHMGGLAATDELAQPCGRAAGQSCAGRWLRRGRPSKAPCEQIRRKSHRHRAEQHAAANGCGAN